MSCPSNFSKALQSAFILLAPAQLFAANLIDVNHQSVSYLQNLITNSIPSRGTSQHTPTFYVLSKVTDRMHMTHIRLKQRYLGHDVWGAELIVHAHSNQIDLAKLPKDSTSNGILYDQLENDLGMTPPDQTSQQAIASNIAADYLKSAPIKGTIQNLQVKIIVYVVSKLSSQYRF